MTPFDFPDASELLRQMQTGEQTAVDIVRTHLDRLEADHLRINAASKIYRQEALAQAENPINGPLSGLPISIKETFGIAHETITAGSKRMTPLRPEQDSDVVDRLRQAGAILIARSNVPEFAMAGETENPLYGRTNNPLDITRTCGGSSGGEGALVASGASALGIGSDILGSLRIPAAFCGVVGFKPASGAVSKKGMWPNIETLHMDSWLSAGPITRSVRDTRLIYNVIAREPLSPPQPVRNLRLIIPKGFGYSWRSDAIGNALVHAQTVLEAEGMRVEERPFNDIEHHFFNLQRMLAQTLAGEMLPLLSDKNGNPFNLTRETANQLRGKPTIYSGLFQLLAAAPLIKQTQGERPVDEMVASFTTARAHYQEMLGSDGILLLPTIGVIAPKHGRMNRDSLRPGVNNTVTSLTFCNYSDLPAISLPAWRDRDRDTGLPAAVMLACAPGAESNLLATAEALEATFKRGQ